jgi:hypothetical protein
MTKDIEDLKRDVWKAIQHPNDGSLNGIRNKRIGCTKTIDHLAATGRIVPEGWVAVQEENKRLREALTVYAGQRGLSQYDGGLLARRTLETAAQKGQDDVR